MQMLHWLLITIQDLSMPSNAPILSQSNNNSPSLGIPLCSVYPCDTPYIASHSERRQLFSPHRPALNSIVLITLECDRRTGAQEWNYLDIYLDMLSVESTINMYRAISSFSLTITLWGRLLLLFNRGELRLEVEHFLKWVSDLAPLASSHSKCLLKEIAWVTGESLEGEGLLCSFDLCIHQGLARMLWV